MKEQCFPADQVLTGDPQEGVSVRSGRGQMIGDLNDADISVEALAMKLHAFNTLQEDKVVNARLYQ